MASNDRAEKKWQEEQVPRVCFCPRQSRQSLRLRLANRRMLIQPLNRSHSTRLTAMKGNGSAQIVVGVDVGGPKKGFHAVALQDGH